DYPLGFSTVPAAGALRDMNFLVGSCYYLDDPLMKMLNISYGTGMEIFQSMARTGGDLMFWLGDNIYFAPFDLSSRYNMNQRYLKQRSAPELQPLLASMPQYAIWDDHDFGPNNSDRTFWGKSDTLDLFNAYWANPRSGPLSTEGTFFSKTWGDVEFFATDNRFHRDPDDDPDPKRAFFGPEQLAWIKSRLLASKATFKVVVVGTPVLNRYYIEAMPMSPEEFNDLMGFLSSNKIPGVVFLSGDRHHTLLMKMDRPGAYPLYEYTSSPLTSNPSHGLNEQEATDPWVVPDTLVLVRNYGRLRIHGKRGERVLTIETLDAKGNLIWDYDLEQKELGY
ncbi:MAG: alkaline phosphatase, partial [Candidatus Sericytochromatia bacterium]